jgi:hypothetical protein
MNGVTNQTHLTGLTVNYPRAVVTYGVLLLLLAAVVCMHSIFVLSREAFGLLSLNAKQRKTNTQWSHSEVGAPSEVR